MPAVAVTISRMAGSPDVDLGDPDLRPVHLRRLIGCAAVHPIWWAADLLMWVADTTDDGSLNGAATDVVMDYSEHCESDHLRDRGLHRTCR